MHEEKTLHEQGSTKAMNIREKTALFILNEKSGGKFKEIDKHDIRDEYPYVLKELVQDGYLDVQYSTNEQGEQSVSAHALSDRGKMRLRMLMEKWEEER